LLLLVARPVRFFLIAREIDELFLLKEILEKFHTTSGRSLLIAASVTREVTDIPEIRREMKIVDYGSRERIQARSGGISIDRI